MLRTCSQSVIFWATTTSSSSSSYVLTATKKNIHMLFSLQQSSLACANTHDEIRRWFFSTLRKDVNNGNANILAIIIIDGEE